MRIRPFPALVGLLVAAAALTAAPARATTVHPFSLDELIYVADRIVVGQVLSTDAAFTRDGGLIVTTVELQVAEVLKGPAAAETLGIQVLGGEAAGLALHVEGAPRFDPGEQVLLFIEEGPHGLEVLGWAQGKLDLEWNAGAGETYAHRRVLVAGPNTDDWMPAAGTPAAALTERIRALVRSGFVPTYREIPGLLAHKRDAFRAHWGLPAVDGEVGR